MARIRQLGPSVTAAELPVLGSVVLVGEVAHATLVAPVDMDPPSLARRVGVEALVDGNWVACQPLRVSGGGGSDYTIVSLTWKPVPGATEYACTF